jgi:AbrB family looped-hinge helix DNA binding protein
LASLEGLVAQVENYAMILTKNFKITIPKHLRENQGWKPGQKFNLALRGSRVEFIPVSKLEDTGGKLESTQPTEFRERQSAHNPSNHPHHIPTARRTTRHLRCAFQWAGGGGVFWEIDED